MIDFSELYRTHAKDVHRFVLFLSGDPVLADDILSETFIRLWHARGRVDLTTVKGYLLTIARNLFLAEIRDAPLIGLTCWVTAAIMWIWHVTIRRRLRVSGL